MPFFTVFTATFNRGYILPKLYDSLKKQEIMDFEWLVIDDGSSDGTEQLFLQWIHDETMFPIRYMKKDNGGKPRAINYGIQYAKGEYFFMVDSDDTLKPDALSKMKQWCKEIMGMAFRKCEALKTVVLPSSLEDIGKDAFYMCPLESVFFDGTEAEFLSVSVAEGNDSILSAAVYFYSETEPTENPQKFWRFSGGKPLPWA